MLGAWRDRGHLPQTTGQFEANLTKLGLTSSPVLRQWIMVGLGPSRQCHTKLMDKSLPGLSKHSQSTRALPGPRVRASRWAIWPIWPNWASCLQGLCARAASRAPAVGTLPCNWHSSMESSMLRCCKESMVMECCHWKAPPPVPGSNWLEVGSPRSNWQWCHNVSPLLGAVLCAGYHLPWACCCHLFQWVPSPPQKKNCFALGPAALEVVPANQGLIAWSVAQVAITPNNQGLLMLEKRWVLPWMLKTQL